MSKPTRDELHGLYGDLVVSIARQLASSLNMSLDVRDLEQYGMIGLLEAWERYDPACGAGLSGYAYYRIRGRMIDSLHLATGLSRTQVRRITRMRSVQDGLECYGGQDAKFERDPAKVVSAMFGLTVVGLEAFEASGESPTEAECAETYGRSESPEAAAMKSERREQMLEHLDALSEEDRYFLVQHYFEDRSISEIASERGVSRSWGSRVRTRGLRALRERLVEARQRRGETSSGEQRLSSEKVARRPGVKSQGQSAQPLVGVQDESL